MDHGGWYVSINKLDTSVLALKSWWDNAERSKSWQDAVFDILCFLHAAVAAVALIQLIRIQRRVPEYGWTTQKVFHLLNFIVNAVRALVFLLRREVQSIDPPVFRYMLLDLPGLLFFSTYTLLVLFWAEIYFQARSLPTDGLHPSYLIVNAVIYIMQFCIWIYYWWTPSLLVRILSNVFFAGVSFFAALGFLLYGGRLFLMLRRFPVESKGRQKKLNEVGFVTVIGVTCFLIRCLMVMLSAFIKKADFDNIYHPIVTGIYQLAVEILPSILVLFILRKLPPKRESGQYHPIS